MTSSCYLQREGHRLPCSPVDRSFEISRSKPNGRTLDQMRWSQRQGLRWSICTLFNNIQIQLLIFAHRFPQVWLWISTWNGVFWVPMMLAGTKTWLMVHGLMVHRAVNGRISVHWENTVESVLSYLLMLHPLYRIAPYCWQLHGEKPCRFV